MAAFPALEVMNVGGHGPPAGTRVPITTLPFTIGRDVKANLQVHSQRAGRRHCEVVFEYGRWWIRSLTSDASTFVLGETIHDAELGHGDYFEVGPSVCFRFLTQEPIERRNAALEAAIAQRPDDESAWSVYADWLQEQGDPLGMRMARPRTEDDLRWVGPFGGAVARGEVEIAGWSHGLPSNVVLRSRSGERPELTWEFRFGTLLRHREFQFVRTLELDIGSFTREAGDFRWGLRALFGLGLEALPALERLVVGPCAVPGDVKEIEGAIAARQKRFPRFVTTVGDLFRPLGR